MDQGGGGGVLQALIFPIGNLGLYLRENPAATDSSYAG